ncbi:MAG: c-type cytochrome [Gemmataceae bacterium]
MIPRLLLLIGCGGVCALPFALTAKEPPPVPEPPRYKSPLGLIVDDQGERAYVALHRAGAVAEVDLKAGKVLREIPVGRGCYDIDRLGNTLYVTCEHDDELAALDLKQSKVVKRWKVGQAPRGVAVDQKKKIVRVACRDMGDEAIVNPRQDEVKYNPNPGSPFFGFPGPDMSPLKKKQPIDSADRDIHFYPYRRLSPERYVNRLQTLSEKQPAPQQRDRLMFWMNNIPSYFNAESSRAIVELDLLAYTIHSKARNELPATQVAQGWVFTNAISKRRWYGGGFGPHQWDAFILDEPQHGYADPSDIQGIRGQDDLDKDLRLFVASAGSEVVLALKEPSFHSRFESFYSKDNLTSSRHFVIAKLPTQANPRRLALSGDGKTLVASNYLGDSLTVIDSINLKVLKHIPLGGSPPDAARRGEILFHSNKLTFQGQFTCASCHPNNESDLLTWDLERDGVGNFKKTKSLLGVKDTGPYGWEGSSPTLADRVRGTLRTLHRHEPTEQEVNDLVAYLESLPPPRPLPVPAAAKPAIARGKVLFEGKAACAKCHPAPTFQDGKRHDIGTRGPNDYTGRFDTPSLRGVDRYPPYLHDGRAYSLVDLFWNHNHEKLHGDAHKLNNEELADLISYLKSL